MKNILIIHHGRGLGGGLIALLGLIEELKVSNNIFVLCIFDSEAVDYIKKSGVHVFFPMSRFYYYFYGIFVHSEASYFEIVNSLRNIKNFVAFLLNKYFFAERELKNIKFCYDIVYLNSTFISDWSFASKKFNKPVIIHVREPLAKGIFGFRKNIIINNINKYCNQIVAISHDNGKRIGLKNKTIVIYDPVVSKNRISYLSSLGLNPKFKYFLYLGGIQRIKGFEQLVKSLPYLNDNIRIYFLGGNFVMPNNKIKKIIMLLDPFMWRIILLFNRLNQSKKIINIGLVDNIFDYYDNSVALVSPFSKPHASLPILEAFSVGKPVIVSDVAGMDEIVNYTNGFFFKNGDEIDLANKINNMSKINYTQYQELCNNVKESYFKIYENNLPIQVVLNKVFSSPTKF